MKNVVPPLADDLPTKWKDWNPSLKDSGICDVCNVQSFNPNNRELIVRHVPQPTTA